MRGGLGGGRQEEPSRGEEHSSTIKSGRVEIDTTRAGATVGLKSLSRFNAPEPEWKEGRREGRRVRVGWHYSHSFVVNAAKAIPGNGGKPFVRPRCVESKHDTTPCLPFMYV